jgi:uncharacterized protein (DUF1684 family)
LYMAEVVVEQSAYHKQIEKWRQEREAALRTPDGWLSLAGLFVLAGGEYTLGSGEDNQIVLPESAPRHVGKLNYQGGQGVLFCPENYPITVDGVPVTSPAQGIVMVDNAEGRQPTMVKFATISLNLHRFGDEVALRVRDSLSPAIAEFAGCKWYEIKDEYCVQGRLLRQESPDSIPVTTSVRSVAQYNSIGAVTFELLGQPLQLLASATSKPDELFLILRDATAGKTTYGAGRYLYAPVDEAGNVVLDFNKAYNPPCAFTPYATCSLPPAQNLLQVAIEAGERY